MEFYANRLPIMGRKGGRMRGVVKGKRWLMLTRWMNLDSQKRQQLNDLFTLNRRVMKAYLLKESLERLWTYHYEGAMLRYLQSWIDQLRWQRVSPGSRISKEMQIVISRTYMCRRARKWVMNE